MAHKTDWKLPAIFIVATELVGALSSLFTGNISSVYRILEKPPLSPPGWLFGIVWPVLYAIIGYAAYRVYHYAKSRPALWLYAVQLAVNFFWTPVFFRYQMYWLAIGVILLLDLLVVLMFWLFYKADRLAGKLIVPYLLWILYATYLNIGMAVLN